MNVENVRIINDAKPENAGAVIYFRRGGGTVQCSDLRKSWGLADLDTKELPKAPSAAAALKRALDEQKSRSVLVRPLKGERGYALVLEQHDEDNDLDYTVDLTVRLDELKLATFNNPEHPLAATIVTRQLFHQTVYNDQDISSFVIDIARKHDAVSLRDTGGIYFIPHTHLDEFNKRAEVLEKNSGLTVFRIPAEDSSNTVKAVLAAIEEEAQKGIEELKAFMYPEEGDPPGERAIKTKMGKVKELTSKVSRYESLLGESLKSFTDKLTSLQSDMTVMTLASMEDMV
jgi:hypothetical protein